MRLICDCEWCRQMDRRIISTMVDLIDDFEASASLPEAPSELTLYIVTLKNAIHRIRGGHYGN